MTELSKAPWAPCLCLDIETARNDQLILRELGAYRPDSEARLRIAGKAPDLVRKLNAFTHGAVFLIGHNIVAFDKPALASLHPELALHRLPLIDTLELSPIAFPHNPYHHLVKDYKLCTTTRNDPVRDAELAYELFLDECEALHRRLVAQPDEVLCLHFLLAQDIDRGMAGVFATLRGAQKPSQSEAAAAWQRVTVGKVCATGQRWLIERCLPDPVWHKPLAFVLAWLGVAGGNSVLPPWVSRKFPKTRDVIAALRDVPCIDPGCNWCRVQHDLEAMLPRYFPGITSFRSMPSTADGRSMQRTIVENGFAGRSTLAILPTGGGKSLCFQLPALARFYRNGSLTVVISPLQSLMKDQVDSLEARGITSAGFLNGLLNPLERRATLEKLRFGDLGLIYVAPEQFRSTAFTNALLHREIGAWVFDEAHCLSKWGHDFRPDYLYVSRFIKARQKDQPSPVFCFTATAKLDVVADICAHFNRVLGVSLECLEGGVSRANLSYEVRPVPVLAKYGEVLRLLQEEEDEGGGAIVFCARQKTVQAVAAFLKNSGLDCGFFHGGMLPAEKRAVQEAFVGGRLRVIAATNAFGMGVDKSDVRLVIHLDTPGSLENYLQEAGRAGRDQAPARCVLLYDEADLDVQFRLLKNSVLSAHDINTILKALRSIERKSGRHGEAVVTSGEILLEIPDQHRIDPDAPDAETKVRVAVAWLEEARLLERHENHTRVFPASLVLTDLGAIQEVLRKRLGADADMGPYLSILTRLLQAGDDEGLSTDDLMLSTGRDRRTVEAMLRELCRWGLLSDDPEIGVTLYSDTARKLDELVRVEDALLGSLREAAPDAEQEGWQSLNMRRLCDTLRRDTQLDVRPQGLGRLLKSFAEPFGESVGQRSLFAFQPQGLDRRQIKLLRTWSEIETIRERRTRVARAVAGAFLSRKQGNSLDVRVKLTELEDALQTDMTLAGLEIGNWDVALSSALLYLDTNEVLHLSRGKALFRTAMNIEFNADARRRQFKKSDYAELALHYKDKIVQVQVMAEYAKLAMHKVQAAMSFIIDYFRMDRADFILSYFAGRKDVLEMATTQEAHRRILTTLANPEQQTIVSTSPVGNHLVLAGPGSGKTKVIVHRVAWLLRECTVLPEEIMVLAYNRSSANEIRRRLWALVGSDAGGVVVQTLHGLAMRLTGTSYAVALEHGETVDFGEVIRRATSLLKSAESGQGDDVGASIARDRLLSGLRFLLVDEYQDINGDHYELISAVAGRMIATEEDRVSLMVVGDDDQNIYAFDGANVRYIRQFVNDYAARQYSLLENYRSTAHIVNCANRVIARARHRMKADHEIRVDHLRRDFPDGGDYAELDALRGGQVHVLEVPGDVRQEVQIALTELQRLYALGVREGAGQWGRYAVIARRWEDLEAMATLCRRRGIPVQLSRDDGQIKLHATREGNTLVGLLRGISRRAKRSRMLLKSGVLSRWFRRHFGLPADGVIDHPFRAALAQFINDTESAAPGRELMVDDIVESLYEFGAIGRNTAEPRPNAPLLLMTAHRAKGLEFDHVLILDGGGWQGRSDEERRLFYVAMTRAKRTLTLCDAVGGSHPFVHDTGGLVLRSQPSIPELESALDHRIWFADYEKIFLSWPGYFAPEAPIHRALAALDVGSSLTLRQRSGDSPGWELADESGVAVTRMSSKFQPPKGDIVAVRVGAIVVRQARDGEQERLHSRAWELVLPEIEYVPSPS